MLGVGYDCAEIAISQSVRLLFFQHLPKDIAKVADLMDQVIVLTRSIFDRRDYGLERITRLGCESNNTYDGACKFGHTC